MTTHRPTREQVLILPNFPAIEIIVTNTALVVEFCNKSLVEACSKLRVESVYKIQDGVSMFTNSVVLVAKLGVIKQWLKKTTGLSEITKVKSCLSQSKSFMKVSDIFYQDSNTSLPITFIQAVTALSSSSLFEGIILASLLCIMKEFSSSDISVIWIDI